MKEPSNGPSVRIANHHEAGVPFPIAETLAITVSVKRTISSELAMAMITTTKIASPTFPFPTYSTIVDHQWNAVIATKIGINQIPEDRFDFSHEIKKLSPEE